MKKTAGRPGRPAREYPKPGSIPYIVTDRDKWIS